MLRRVGRSDGHRPPPALRSPQAPRLKAPLMRGFFFYWVLARRSDVLASHLKAIWASWGDLRKFVCCGAPTPTQSVCACWGHWMALPEDHRSELLASYGRGEVANYHRNLLKAVEIWRRCGVWRIPVDES